MLIRLGVDSLGLRLGATFLAGAIALQCVLLLVVLWPGGPGRPVFLLTAPEDAAAMAEALERAPPALQPSIVRALNSDSVRVHLGPDFPPEPPAGHAGEDTRLERLFAHYGEALEGRAYRVQTQAGGGVMSGYGGNVVGHNPVRLVLRLRTGQMLVIERSPPTAVRRFQSRAAIIGIGSFAVLALVLFTSWQQTAQPVTALARGARRFAHDLSTPDLPVRGAREVKDLSTAFNEMKHTIRTLMDERTRMLAAIAHDLRTYLTRLRLRAEFIGDPEQRDRAVADLDEMSLLLDDALTFARDATIPAAEARETVDVAQAIETLAATRSEMGQAVVFAGVRRPVRAHCAPLALRRMLDNLVDNAVRYAGGARLGLAVEAGEVQIAVDDEGPGVPEEALARLTAPFERLEASRARHTGGAGLGLAIVKALAEGQGGRLSIVNRTEGGLRVSLHLPAAPAVDADG